MRVVSDVDSLFGEAVALNSSFSSSSAEEKHIQ